MSHKTNPARNKTPQPYAPGEYYRRQGLKRLAFLLIAWASALALVMLVFSACAPLNEQLSFEDMGESSNPSIRYTPKTTVPATSPWKPVVDQTMSALLGALAVYAQQKRKQANGK